MKNTLKLSIRIVLLFVLASGCSSNDTENDSFLFQPEIGDSWEYKTTTVQNYFDDDNNPGFLTLNSTNIVTVENYGEVINSYSTFLFHEITTDDIFGNSEGYNYYEISESGMKLIAYQGAAFLSMPKRSDNTIVNFKGHLFASLDEFIFSLQNGMAKRVTNDDNLIIENIPPQVYNFPFQIGEQWTYRQISNPMWRIDKKVVAHEVVSTTAGNFECYKIQWLYDMDNNSEWDEDLIFYDYVSSIGLVKRTIEIESVSYSSINNPAGELSMHVLTTMELESYNGQ